MIENYYIVIIFHVFSPLVYIFLFFGFVVLGIVFNTIKNCVGGDTENQSRCDGSDLDGFGDGAVFCNRIRDLNTQSADTGNENSCDDEEVFTVVQIFPVSERYKRRGRFCAISYSIKNCCLSRKNKQQLFCNMDLQRCLYIRVKVFSKNRCWILRIQEESIPKRAYPALR